MDRRRFLKLAGLTLGLNTLPIPWAMAGGIDRTGPAQTADTEGLETGIEDPSGAPEHMDQAVKDRLVKSRHFNRKFQDDVILSTQEFELLKACQQRIDRVQNLVGFGNFCLTGFDEALAYARNYSRVGRFTKAELDFLETLFYYPAKSYGFMGEKTIEKITGTVQRKYAVKVPHTGNWLYQGKPMQMYADIQKRIGPDAVLTSGIRGVMKQFLLFLNKAIQSRGNLSMASRSLAPPGYSFHGIGDFDVGEKGFEVDNFTEKFTQTRIYSQLTDLGYIKFRYDRGNDLGVRFEPWHVEVNPIIS